MTLKQYLAKFGVNKMLVIKILSQESYQKGLLGWLGYAVFTSLTKDFRFI